MSDKARTNIDHPGPHPLQPVTLEEEILLTLRSCGGRITVEGLFRRLQQAQSKEHFVRTLLDLQKKHQVYAIEEGPRALWYAGQFTGNTPPPPEPDPEPEQKKRITRDRGPHQRRH